jgi:VWFA-related protein
LGVPVTALSTNNFKVFENGNPKPINSITYPITSPISVELVLDFSGSLAVSDQLAIQDAAIAFVDTLTPNQDEAGLIKFKLNIDVNTGFTTDLTAIKTAIGDPYPAGRPEGTILYDSLIQAINDTAGRVAASRRGAVIVFSDGNDEESVSTLENVIDLAVLKGVPIFTIAYTNASKPKPEVMQELAQRTGGEYFLAPDSTQLNTIYGNISNILSQQYLIEYNTLSSGGTTVSLDIEVNDNNNLGEDSKEATGC